MVVKSVILAMAVSVTVTSQLVKVRIVIAKEEEFADILDELFLRGLLKRLVVMLLTVLLSWLRERFRLWFFS